MNNSNENDFNKDHLITILYNTLCCLNYLHSADIMHRDIKPANLLVDGECQVKLCDFGFSRTVPTNRLIAPATGVTSPKIINRNKFFGFAS